MLAIFIIAGWEIFGILGAIIGGVVGNSITDGLAGIFEGYEWEKIRASKMRFHKTAHCFESRGYASWGRLLPRFLYVPVSYAPRIITPTPSRSLFMSVSQIKRLNSL